MSDELNSSTPRRRTRAVRIGSVTVGGDFPVVVQSMTNTDTVDVLKTAIQCAELARAGSELVRITVNTPEAAAAGAVWAVDFSGGIDRLDGRVDQRGLVGRGPRGSIMRGLRHVEPLDRRGFRSGNGLARRGGEDQRRGRGGVLE